MNILYAGDKNVECGIFASALSVAKCSPAKINFYILTASIDGHKKIDEDFARILSDELSAISPFYSVRLIDITDLFLGYLPSANMSTRFTPFCMLRLFSDKVEDIPEKILYLDADVLCRGDISPLYETDVSGVDIAGVPDRYGKWFFGNILRHDYFNSGVLLINMKRVRENGIFDKCRSLLRDKKMFMPDQSAINKICKKKKLPLKYNDQGKIRKNTILKHFTTFFRFFPYFKAVTVKPWQRELMHKTLGIYEFDKYFDKYYERTR